MGFTQRAAAGASALGASSLTVPFAVAVPAGAGLLVVVTSADQIQTVTSLADTQGNTYVRDSTLPAFAYGESVELWRCAAVTTALTAADSITATLSGAQPQGIVLIADQFTTLGTPDVGSATGAGPVTSLSDTVAASAADVALYAVCATASAVTGLAVASPFTDAGPQAGSSGVCARTAYVNSPAGGSYYTAAYSWATAATAAVAVFGYPVGPGLPVTVSLPPAAVTVAAGNVTVLAPYGIAQQVSGTSQNDYGLLTIGMSMLGPRSAPDAGDGNTLVVLAGWDLTSQPVSATMPAAWVTDSAGNYWYHVATSTPGVTGSRCTAWICPNARQISWLSISLTTFASSLAATVIEVANMPQYYSLDVSAANATPSASALTVSPGTASAAGIVFSVLSSATADAAPGAMTGWNALTPVSSGGTSPSPVQIFPAWRPATAGDDLTTSWTLPDAAALAGITFAAREAAPAPVQANPNFPILKVEAGFGYTPGDPSQAPPEWADITGRVIGKEGDAFLSPTMGRGYELTQMEAGSVTVQVNNQDGAFTAGNTASPYYPDVVLGTPVHVSAWWGGAWYHVAFGYVKKWPQDWPDLPQFGISKMTASDAVSVMSWATLPAALDGDMLLDGPYVFIQASEQYTNFVNGINPAYSYADPQGLLAANTSRVNQRAAMYVDGTASAGATGQSTQMLGDGDSGFGTTSITTAPTVSASGPGIIYTDPSMPDPTSPNGVAVEFWLLISATVASASLQPTVFQAFGPPSAYKTANPSLSVQVLNFTGSNTLKVTLADGSSVSATFNTSTAPQQVVLNITTSSLSVYVNGALATTKSLTASQTTAWYAMTLGCCNYAYQSGALGTGNFTAFDWALYPAPLPSQRIVSHYVTGALGQQNVDATQRMAQVLAWANLGIPRAGQVTFNGAPAGVTQGPAYNVGGASAAAALNQLAINETGMVFAAPSGAVVFMHREALLNQVPVATFGDSASVADGEVPYQQSTGFDYDWTYLYNATQTTQTVGPNATITASANDFTSQQEYFLRSALQQNIQTTSDLDAFDSANWAAAKYSQPAMRLRTITIDASSNPAVAFPVILALQQGQVVRVVRRPVGGAVISGLFLVQKIQHAIGPASWKTTMQLSPYSLESAVLQLDAPPDNTIGIVTLA